jgi:hypothetical protein
VRTRSQFTAVSPGRSTATSRSPSGLNHPLVKTPCGFWKRRLNPYATTMHTIELDDDELRLVRAALTAYLEDFGHEEADILRAVKAVLAKLPPPS